VLPGGLIDGFRGGLGDGHGQARQWSCASRMPIDEAAHTGAPSL